MLLCKPSKCSYSDNQIHDLGVATGTLLIMLIICFTVFSESRFLMLIFALVIIQILLLIVIWCEYIIFNFTPIHLLNHHQSFFIIQTVFYVQLWMFLQSSSYSIHLMYVFNILVFLNIWNWLHPMFRFTVGQKTFSQPPIVQVLPIKKMREACNFHHRYTSTMRDEIRKKNPENHIVGFLKKLKNLQVNSVKILQCDFLDLFFLFAPLYVLIFN